MSSVSGVQHVLDRSTACFQLKPHLFNHAAAGEKRKVQLKLLAIPADGCNCTGSRHSKG